MSFNIKKFKSAKFTAPVGEIPLPAVFNDFFDEGEKPVWKVRGLTGQEVGRAAMAASKNKNLAGMFEAANSGSYQKIVKMYKELAGISDKVPQLIAEAMAKIEIASVEPEADLELIALVCTRSPTAFYAINMKIKELTEGGMILGKPKGSGKTKK